MTFSDNTNPGNFGYDSPNASPDSVSHLDKIRSEVSNHQEPPQFYGLDAGIFKLGFTSDGAFNPGINLGIVHAEVKVGLVDGADAGVNLGPLADAQAGVYAGIDQNGIYGNAGAGADALGLAGTHGYVDSRFGNATGADAGAGAYVGPIAARTGSGVALGQDGFDAATSDHARIGQVLGVHAGGHFGLGDNSQVAAAAGGHLGDLGVSSGAGVWTDGDSTIRPDVYVRGRAGYERGIIDLNAPVYGGELPSAQGVYPGQVGDRTPYGPAGQGQSAPIESQPLPPVHEAATPENIKRVDQQIRTELDNQATYTVRHGDNYRTIAARLMPGADPNQLATEAQKLQQMHEDNGYNSLRAGQKICTVDPYTLDRETRQAVAKHFGLAIPQS